MPRDNGRGVTHGLSKIERNPPEVEMAAFDELPFAVRLALNTFPLPASAVEIRGEIQKGASVKEVLRRSAINRRQIPLSFVKERGNANKT